MLEFGFFWHSCSSRIRTAQWDEVANVHGLMEPVETCLDLRFVLIGIRVDEFFPSVIARIVPMSAQILLSRRHGGRLVARTGIQCRE